MLRCAPRGAALFLLALASSVSSLAQDGDFWEAEWGASIEDLRAIEAGGQDAGPEQYVVDTSLFGSSFLRLYELVDGELAMGAYIHVERGYVSDDHYAEVIVALKNALIEKYGKPKERHRGRTRWFVHDSKEGVSVLPEIALGQTELLWVWPKLERTLIELSVSKGSTEGGRRIAVFVRYRDKSRLSRLEEKWAVKRQREAEEAKGKL